MDKALEQHIDAMITLRLIAFHDALVQRRQIPPTTGEITAGYTEDQASYAGPSPQPSVPTSRR